MLKDTLIQALHEGRTRLEALDSERRMIELDVRACEAALAVFDGSAAPNVLSSETKPTRSASPRTRSISNTWRDILEQTGRMVSANPTATSFTLADVEAAAAAVNHQVSPENVRSQMATYVNRGLLARVRPGEFMFALATLDDTGAAFPTRMIASIQDVPEIVGDDAPELDNEPSEEDRAQ